MRTSLGSTTGLRSKPAWPVWMQCGLPQTLALCQPESMERILATENREGLSGWSKSHLRTVNPREVPRTRELVRLLFVGTPSLLEVLQGDSDTAADGLPGPGKRP